MMNYWTQFANRESKPNKLMFIGRIGDGELYKLDTTIKTDKKMERELCDLIFQY